LPSHLLKLVSVLILTNRYNRLIIDDGNSLYWIQYSICSIDSGENMSKSELINNKGMIELNRRKYSRALELFNKSIEADHEHSFPWGNRAIALLHLDRPNEALESVDHAISIDASNSKFWNTKGGILFRMGKMEDAEKCLRTAIEIQQDNDEAWSNLGTIYRFRQEWDDANDSYDHALSINRKSTVALVGKGQIENQLGKYDEAIRLINKALEIDNLDPIAWNEKGYSLSMKGELLEAEKCFEASLHIDPDFADAIGNKGEISRRLGKIQEAESYINKAIEKQPNNANNWNNKGALLAATGKLEEALHFFNKALEINPQHLDALTNMTGILGALGRFDEAEKALQSISFEGEWKNLQLPTLYLPKESPDVPPSKDIRPDLSEFYSEIIKSSLVALRSFQASKPVYVKGFIEDNDIGLKETDFRDDFKRLMEMRYENTNAECKYGDGLSDIRIQKANSQLESIIFEFKIWGRNDYLDVVAQTRKYVTSFENCAIIIMINPKRKTLDREYPEKIILDQESYINGTLETKPFMRNSNMDHYSSEHKTETGKSIKIFHFILDIFQ